jgi:DNA-binding transcriptional regulator YiaG
MTTKANEPSKIVVSTRREEPTLGRYRLTDSGALMRLMPDGSWESITPQVDWDRINHTTDAEIERQEIADLVEDALELEAGSFTALAARLQVSPSSVRRWRRGRVMPSIAHQQRLKCLFAAPVNA